MLSLVITSLLKSSYLLHRPWNRAARFSVFPFDVTVVRLALPRWASVWPICAVVAS